ncbi:unnamed protein product [Prunus armeniaca]|uniref:Synergin gamma C-terminal domain-containing protein n=1 Tax=Prunus armeniaca TaxID=36596 RepID=A0A6J5VC03_PRUAR|nr:unnamed protein product [Prunus armeniaca]
MAEDDDAEGFGDFKFVTAVDPNPKINGRVSTVSDDDWGDFVTHNTSQIKTQAVLSNGLTYSQSPPTQIPYDPFGFFNIANGSAPSRPNSEPSRVDTEPEKVDKTRWMKPQGALPLSLFGEEQEEEKSGAGESRVGDVATGLTKNEGFVKNELNLNVSSVGINDLIANLYGQNPKFVVQNGSNSNLGSGGLNSTIKGLNFSPNTLDLKFDSLIPNENGKFGSLNSASNGLDLKFDGVDSHSNLGSGTPHSTKNGVNFSANALDLKFDPLNANKNGQFGVSNGLDLKFDGVDSNSNTNGLKFDWEEGNGDFDGEDDDGWEFKAADSERQVSNENFKEQGVVEVAGSKVESNAFTHLGIQENTGGTGLTWGFGIDAPEFNNVSFPSLGNDQWGFSFDFNPSPVTQDNFFLDLHSKNKPNNAETVPNSSPVDGNVWEFKDALSENGSKHKLGESKAAIPSGLDVHSLDGVSARAHNEFFAGSDGISHKSGENNFAFPFIPNSCTEDCIVSDSYSSDKKDDIAKGSSCSPANDHVESDDNFWEFKDAFSESGSRLEGESVIARNPPTNIKPPAISDEIQHNEVTLESHRQALPLSIFGDEELETDDSSIHEDISTHAAVSHQINTAKSPVPNISITDLISSLYSQVDQNTNAIHAPKATENPPHPASTVLESVLGDDDFDDDSWEFKDAVSRDQDQTSITNLEHSPQNSLTKVQLDNLVDFYCQLKDESYFLALRHLDNKKAQSSAILSGKDTTVEALEEEIQKLYNELHQDIMISDQFQSGNPSQRNACLNEFHKVLKDPKFQVLESEYQLSQRLSLAEKDLRSSIELSRHAASTLRILRLGSNEEQSNYISTWSQIVSICAQELKHGSSIWMQSIENNVQNQILSDPQGKQYILALGEIYRVVLVVGTSAKLYKPWTLLHSSDSSSLFALLNECSTLWSSSGLNEALKSIADAIDFKYDGTVNALLESMTYVHHIDAFALQNHVVNGQQPTCSLSLLTAGAVPGIKMVVWNGEHFLLTLANLWTNLISPDPPKLPHLSYS